MKRFSVLCVALGIGLSSTAAFGRGGMGSSSPMMVSSQISVTGGALGMSAATPGTNSLGTAFLSSGNSHRLSGPLLGTSAAIDREEATVDD